MMKVLAVGFGLLLAGACAQGGGQAPVPAGLTVPSSLAAASPQRPWQAHLTWTVTDVQWPEGAAPFSGVTSDFGGRCAGPSDYVIHAKFEGQATHAGTFTGQGAHCTQLHMTAEGPGVVTWSDGRGTLVVADGSTLSLRWGDGTTGFDPGANEFWFKDHFTFAGGSGRFVGATGGGEEGGRFTDFMALLAGTPAPMTMEGTISYPAGNH